jgi:AcrR family transcriptional regulator
VIFTSVTLLRAISLYVVDAATALADAEGLDAVTMRRVATSLGVVPMTLYTYVPGKAELRRRRP